jgi:carbonic anhydrase
MSVIDEVLEANEIYSRTHELRKLTPRPERSLAVLTCMDTRLAPKKSNPCQTPSLSM